MEKITLRLPDELHSEVSASAKRARRSLNSEIVRAIEFYLENAPDVAFFKEQEQKQSLSKQ